MEPRRLLHSEVVETLVKLVQDKFKQEIPYYTHPRMATTTQDAGKEHEDQWTKVMYDKQIITTLPGVDAAGKKQDRFLELERTLTALYNILLLNVPAEEGYPYFKAAQYDYPEDRQLSLDNFKKIHALRNDIAAEGSENLELLIYFIIYSDFGKSPRIRELLAENQLVNIDPKLPPDDLIAAILKNLNDEQIVLVLPSFAELSEINKQRIKEYYPLMAPCFGHIMFYERGQRIFEMIGSALIDIRPEKREEAIQLLFMAQFGDGMGAQGQGRINGSATCNNDFYETYDLMYHSLLKLEQALRPALDISQLATAAEEAFNYNLKVRAKWLGFTEQSAYSHEAETMIRIGAMIRCPKDGTAAQLLIQCWNELSEMQRQITMEQLCFHPQTLSSASDNSVIPLGLEDWTRVDYVATAPLNLSQDLMKQGKTLEAIQKGMTASICLAMLLEYIAKKYPEAAKDPRRAISLGIFASFTRSNPDFYNPERFDPSKICRLNLDTNKVEVEEKQLSPLLAQSLLAAKPKTPPPSEATASSSLSSTSTVTARFS